MRLEWGHPYDLLSRLAWTAEAANAAERVKSFEVFESVGMIKKTAVHGGDVDGVKKG